MLRVVDCSACKGKKIVQALEECDGAGDWHPLSFANLSPELADAWIAKDRDAPVRWIDQACPRCAGAGEYVLEFTPCKIF